jgi:hypothetical protein
MPPLLGCFTLCSWQLQTTHDNRLNLIETCAQVALELQREQLQTAAFNQLSQRQQEHDQHLAAVHADWQQRLQNAVSAAEAAAQTAQQVAVASAVSVAVARASVDVTNAVTLALTAERDAREASVLAACEAKHAAQLAEQQQQWTVTAEQRCNDAVRSAVAACTELHSTEHSNTVAANAAAFEVRPCYVVK